MTRAILAVVALLIAGLLSAVGPYADVRTRLAPRPPLEERPVTNAGEMIALMDSLGEEGRRVYVRQIRWDFVIVGANAAWLWIWLRAVGRRALRQRLATVLPAVVATLPALADMVENIALLQVIAAHPASSGGVISVAGAATGVKLILFAAAVAMALVLTVLAAVTSFRAGAARRTVQLARHSS